MTCFFMGPLAIHFNSIYFVGKKLHTSADMLGLPLLSRGNFLSPYLLLWRGERAFYFPSYSIAFLGYEEISFPLQGAWLNSIEEDMSSHKYSISLKTVMQVYHGFLKILLSYMHTIHSDRSVMHYSP